MEILWRDLRFGLRVLSKSPGFASLAILTLALGLGASTAVFSVLYQAVLKPLPYPHGDRLVFVHNVFPANQVPVQGVSSFDYAQIKRRTGVFSAAGIFYYNDLVLTGEGDARHVDVVNSSASLFDVLAVSPQLGRVFSESDDRPGAPKVTILSDATWRSTYGSDPKVIGRLIHFNAQPYTVIGVMPPSFQFPSRATQFWIPIALSDSAFTLQGGRLEKWLRMIARLSPDATSQQTQAALQSTADGLVSAFPRFYSSTNGWHFTMRPIADEQTESVRRWLYLALGAVLSIFLIACINVSGLLFIHAGARTPEVAVKMAMGAGTIRIVRQMLAETALLTFAGCGLGVLLAAWAVHLLHLYGPLSQPGAIHGWALLFALLLAGASTFGAGLLPALLAARLPVEQALRSGASRTSTGAARLLPSAMVAGELALALALIFTATQLSRSFLKLTQTPAGFAPEHVWTGAIDLPGPNYTADQSWNTQFFEPLLAELSSIPGVELASAVNALPFNPSGVWTQELRLPDRPKSDPPPQAQVGLAFPQYFQAIGIPLIQGRTFTNRDRQGSPLVAIIDEQLARQYFPGENPLDKLIGSGGTGTPARIIGVVGSVHNRDLSGPYQPQVYYPELQERSGSTYLVLRMKTGTDPPAAVRRAIAKFDPGVALYDVSFMDARVADSLALRRFDAFLLNALAIAGMILAAVGLYGSLAHLVDLRRREISVRVALGASPSAVLRLLLVHAVPVVAAGLAVGSVLSLIAGLAVRTQLFRVTAIDPIAGAFLLAGIVGIAAASLSLPAWRATRIDPATALRHE